MHPTPRHEVSHECRMWARVMPGVRQLDHLVFEVRGVAMVTICPKLIALIILLLFVLTAIGCGNPSGSTSSKEVRILQEQKDASESLTRHAVELIKENRLAEVRQHTRIVGMSWQPCGQTSSSITI